MQKTLQYCKAINDDDKPTLPTAPPPLASTYIHSDRHYTIIFMLQKIITLNNDHLHL